MALLFCIETLWGSSSLSLASGSNVAQGGFSRRTCKNRDGEARVVFRCVATHQLVPSGPGAELSRKVLFPALLLFVNVIYSSKRKVKAVLKSIAYLLHHQHLEY